jgi:hypothetical protein
MKNEVLEKALGQLARIRGEVAFELMDVAERLATLQRS